MSSKLAAIALSLVLLAGGAAARDVTDPYDEYRSPGEGSQDFPFDDSDVEKWREQEVEVPVLSEDGLRQIRIDHGPAGGMKFFLDLETLSVSAEDDIVRYWVVTESGGQRSNILYEGISCADRQYKTYAYASPRRASLIRYVKSPRWEEVGGSSSGDFHHELVDNYFCTRGMPQPLDGIHAAVGGRINTSSEEFQDGY
jgi:hypothetical protein